MTEFNLSEKIYYGFYHYEDVKEFIKRIYMTMLFTPSPKTKGEFIKWLAKEIDALAGDKLV